MATLKAKNYSLINNKPQSQVPVGDVSGKERFMYDEIDLTAEVALNDLIMCCASIPANARIIGAGIVSPQTGATGGFSLGTAADAAYFVAAVNTGAGAVNTKMASEAGFLVKASTSLQPILKCTTATTAATGKTVKVFVKYILE
jgi:hypothetical protein